VALSVFWFFYLGAFGILLPYFSLYLSDNAGLGGTEVGVIVTMSPLAALVAPTFWGSLADRSPSRARILALAALGAAASTATLAVLEGFWQVAAGAAALAVFSTGAMPLAVSVTLAELGDGAMHRFGRIRVWGTVGFLVLVVLFPVMLHEFQRAFALSASGAGPREPGLWIMFPVASLLIAISTLVALTIPEAPRLVSASTRGDWLELRRHGPFVRLLAISFATFLLGQGPMSLFPLYLRARGRGLDTLSEMWILMLLLEIPLLAFSGAGLRRFGARGVLAVGIAAGGVRWLGCGLTHDIRAIYAMQLLHGVTVAGVGVGSALYLEASVPGRLRSTCQGLNATAGVGVGSSLSNVATGWLMDHASADAPFVIGGAGTLLVALLVPVLLPTPQRVGSDP
jgi:MFS transporter, PPP family, 3-phenylpropionic acid transporter